MSVKPQPLSVPVAFGQAGRRPERPPEAGEGVVLGGDGHDGRVEEDVGDPLVLLSADALQRQLCGTRPAQVSDGRAPTAWVVLCLLLVTVVSTCMGAKGY